MSYSARITHLNVRCCCRYRGGGGRRRSGGRRGGGGRRGACGWSKGKIMHIKHLYMVSNKETLMCLFKEMKPFRTSYRSNQAFRMVSTVHKMFDAR